MAAPISNNNSSSNSSVSATPTASIKMSGSSSSSKSFPTPSFVSPVPGAMTSKEQMQRTLSGGMKKKQKRKLDRELLLAANDKSGSESSGLIKKKHKLSSSSSTSPNSIGMARLTPQQQLQQIKLKMKLKAAARGETTSTHSGSSGAFVTPQRVANPDKKSKKPLQDISNSSRSSETPASENYRKNDASSTTHIPTRKLDFNRTPDKDTSATKKQKNRAEEAAATIGPVTAASSDSPSSSDSSDSSSESGYSSDEAEVSFDAITLGNTRIIREAESPFSCVSTTSTSSLRPVGLEYRFSVSSTVSSIAVAPNGQFLVVGFYNGTIYLYPLNRDSFRFRGGVLLDHITARGMYTQLMVRVAIPEDGKFIFAGVYRGSTEIRAFEVDSIKFPASDLVQTSSSKDSDNENESDDEDGEFGAPHAQAVSHTYSDAKLKGFGAVKSIVRSKTSSTEYHLLCGLGIKNLHLWRFFQQPKTKEWSWECIFDKQANGISLEFLSFHPSVANQIISKSEHQNIRIWTLEEEYHDDDFTTVTLHKKSHVDVKNTVDTTAVYGDYAYGGSESLAMINLSSASRLELDLPLSTKEQQAQLDAAAATKKTNARITASMRQRNSRRRGGTTGTEELGGMRHMRTVSQVAGRETSPFTVGMCSDGSVFFHKPESVLGMATPLEYVEGYERFFQDPSLSFQAQFSDLTRVNTSGILSVLPLPATEKEDWMIVAANQDQLLVRSLKAFLCRNQQIIEQAKVKRGLRNVMRDLGGADSSSSSSGSSSESESEQEFEAVSDKRSKAVKQEDKAASGPIASGSTLGSSSKSLITSEKKEKNRVSPANDKKRVDKPSEVKKEKRPTVGGAVSEKPKKASPVNAAEAVVKDAAKSAVAEKVAPPMPLVVTTPKRRASSSNGERGGNPVTPRIDVASPVVSISSLSSGTSNPNTPEHSKLSQHEKQLLVLKDLEWTPPQKAPSASRDPQASAAAAKEKSSKPRTKALFTNNEDAIVVSSANGKVVSSQETTTTSSKVTKSSSKKSTKQPVLATKMDNGGDAKSTFSVSSKAVVSHSNKKKQTNGGSENQVMVEEVQPESDVEMEEEEGEDDELEELEEQEPKFITMPLASDGGSLLSASLFQFQVASPEETEALDALQTSGDDDITLNEQANLLLHFAAQNERLKRNFYVEKERIYQQLDCSCSSTSSLSLLLKKKAAAASSSAPVSSVAAAAAGPVAPKMNWKKSLSGDFLKRKQLKRRQKKQIALKLRSLHGKYESQIHELLAVHKLQADALTARQKFNHFYQQIQSAASPAASPLEASRSTASASSTVSAEPQRVSISFPYPSLLSSSSSSSSSSTSSA